MLLQPKPRHRVAKKYEQCQGGRYCVCGDLGPRDAKRARRYVRRVERRQWKRDEGLI